MNPAVIGFVLGAMVPVAIFMFAASRFTKNPWFAAVVIGWIGTLVYAHSGVFTPVYLFNATLCALVWSLLARRRAKRSMQSSTDDSVNVTPPT